MKLHCTPDKKMKSIDYYYTEKEEGGEVQTPTPTHTRTEQLMEAKEKENKTCNLEIIKRTRTKE